MKKIFLFTIILFTMFSCSNNESKMKNGIIDYLNKNAKDPKSYEFVELNAIDTITIGECAKNLITTNIGLISKDSIEIFKIENDIKNELQDIDYNDLKIESDKIISSYKSMIKLKNSDIKHYENENIKLNKITNLKDVVFFNANHKFRLKNGFGALDLVQEYVLFDKEFNVKNMTTDILDLDNTKDELFKETDFYKKL